MEYSFRLCHKKFAAGICFVGQLVCDNKFCIFAVSLFFVIINKQYESKV